MGLSEADADAETLRYVLEQGCLYRPDQRRRIRLPQTYALASCSDNPQHNKGRKILRHFLLVHAVARELPAVFASKLFAQCPNVQSDLCLDLMNLTLNTFDTFKTTALQLLGVDGSLEEEKENSYGAKDSKSKAETKQSSAVAVSSSSSSSSSSEYVIAKETSRDLLIKLCLVRSAASFAERTCRLLRTMVNRMSTPTVNDVVRTFVGVINDYPTDFGKIKLCEW